jgi:hypothetical protein
MQKVAEEYGVGRVTVGDWKKKRSEVEKWCSGRTSTEGMKERKTMKKCEYEKVSEAGAHNKERKVCNNWTSSTRKSAGSSQRF